MGLHSCTEQELAEIQALFDSYAREHGDRFEDSCQPMTPEDTADTERRRKRFSKIFWIIYGCVLVGIAAGLLFGKRPEGTDYYVLLSLIGFPLIYRWMIMFGFSRVLKNAEKRVIHGVITNKQVKGKSLYIEFNRKLAIAILPDEYKMLSLGDIVSMEVLAREKYIKKKIVIEGRI